MNFMVNSRIFNFKKYFMIACLSSVSSLNYATASTSLHSINDKINFHRGEKTLKSSYPKKNTDEIAREVNYSKKNISSSFKPFIAKEIIITFENQHEAVQSLLNQYIGVKITEQELIAITNQVSSYYISKDYLFPQITIDKESMKHSVLKIEVTAASFNNIIVLGDAKENRLIKSYAQKISTSIPARKSVVQKYIALMNKIPGHRVSYNLLQNISKEHNDRVVADLVIYTSQKKLSVFTGIDNFGTKNYGKLQGIVSAELFNPFSSGDALMAHGFVSDHPKNLTDGGIGYKTLVNSFGSMVHFFVSHSKTKPRNNLPDNIYTGTGNNLRSYVTHPLFISAHKDLELEIGVTHKNLKNQTINQIQSNEQVSRYNTGDIGLNYSFSDDLKGNNLLNLKYINSISGKFTNYTNGRVPDKKFKILKLNYKRDQIITEDISVFTHLTAINSNNYLPDSDKAALGGSEMGRGYNSSVLAGNKLLAGFIEARYTKKIEDSNIIDHLQPYLFIDTGHISDKNISGTTKNLSSTGLGLRIKFLKRVDLGLEVAEPLKRTFLVNGEKVKSKTKFNIFLNKIFEF